MGNRRSWARRNKKSSNWKVIKKIREEKKKSKNHNTEFATTIQTSESLENNELSDKAIRVVSSKNQNIDFGNDEYDDTITANAKRTSSSEIFQTTFVDTSNIYACLGENEDDDEHNTTNESIDPFFDDASEEVIRENGVDENDIEENDVEENDVDENDVEENNVNDSFSEGANLTDDEEIIVEGKVTGRRVFEVADLVENIKRIGDHSKNCTFKDMTLIGETKKGLNSIFKFQCDKCGTLRKLESCPKKRNSLNCNEAAVLGINLIGSGFSHLHEFLSNLGIPCMGATLYDSISKLQQSDWVKLAKESALNALYEEIELAIAAGDVDVNGKALIAVICDGGWGKRSYGKKFNSLSGCAVLIGVRTKKVIFYGTRNKYCHVCKIAQAKFTPVREHECNIDYTGPSSGMEADIILEGFKSSEQHGARFYKLIADGDSSTYKILRDYRLYKDPDLIIEKLECVNHLCRNFRSKFGFLDKVCKFNSKLRKQIKPSKANEICKGVKGAAKYYRQLNLSLREKMSRLEDDIMNCPYHYFGVHTKCKGYFCSKTTTEEALNNLELLKQDGIFYEILNLVQVYFASNSKSLLENYTNNSAEEFNNLVAKYLGGKRICFSLARSYNGRVASAVVQRNSHGHTGTEFRKFKLGDGHESSTKKMELSRKRKLIANEAALRNKPRNRHPKEDNTTGAYFHGDGFEKLDKTPENFERCKEIFLKKLKERQRIRRKIERETLDKTHASYWQEIRQDLLPSTHFPTIVKAQSAHTLTNKLNEIMYKRSEFGKSNQIRHQQLVERDALNLFKDLFKDEIIQECGLFIDKELPFLCSSPFRLCGTDHILTVKCPINEYNKPFEDVMHKISFFKKKDDHFIINEKSDWFVELQGDMHVTGKKFAYLMIWLGESSYRVVEVAKNDDYFEKNMKPKLNFFYMKAMLQELVDPRVKRRMPLRVYDDATETFV